MAFAVLWVRVWRRLGIIAPPRSLRQVSANSCVPGSPGCDHLPVDQDDPEKRIAELERVPGEPSAAARKRRRSH